MLKQVHQLLDNKDITNRSFHFNTESVEFSEFFVSFDIKFPDWEPWSDIEENWKCTISISTPFQHVTASFEAETISEEEGRIPTKEEKNR